MLPREHRLKKEYDFFRVKRHGQRVAGRYFSLGFAKASTAYPRFGFIATKGLGNAVLRHRAVRLLRAAVRQNLDRIKTGHDYVLVARKGIVGAKAQEVNKELERVLGKAKLLDQTRL